MSSSPFPCTCAEDEGYCGYVSLSYCIPCAASDGHCECECHCDQCKYTDTPCEDAPEGPCIFCSIRKEGAAQPCCEADSPCDDCIVKARTVPNIRIPPSADGVSTPTPFVVEEEQWWEGEDEESMWDTSLKTASSWVAAVKRGRDGLRRVS